jgi:hypothetical protein
MLLKITNKVLASFMKFYSDCGKSSGDPLQRPKSGDFDPKNYFKKPPMPTKTLYRKPQRTCVILEDFSLHPMKGKE